MCLLTGLGFKALTGLPCPTCGLTRALCHALRGDWAGSVSYHPAGILVAAGVIGWALWSFAEAGRGRPLADLARRRLGRSLAVIVGVVSIGFWIARLTAP